MSTEKQQSSIVKNNQALFSKTNTDIIAFSKDDLVLDSAEHTASKLKKMFIAFPAHSDSLSVLSNTDWNVLILDEKIGIDYVRSVVTEARKQSARKQIIFISALDSNRIDELIILDVDDYIVRPYVAQELKFRIELALAKNSNLQSIDYGALANTARYTTQKVESSSSETVVLSDEILNAGDITIHLVEKRCFIRSAQIQLTKTEFDLLTYLIKSRYWTCSNRELLENVLGYKNGEYLPALYSHMRRLRRKISSTGSINTRITTIWKHGYRLEVCNENPDQT